MPFGGLLLTNFGVQMNAKTQQGKKLILTRVALGDDVLGSASPSTFPVLLSERVSFPISTVRAADDESVIIFHFSNAALEQGFFYRAIGVYAKDPDTSVEKLYLYDNCRGEGQYIDDKRNLAQRINCYMRLHIKFSQTELIEFTPGGDPIYVLYEEFNAHVQDYTTRITALEAEVAQQGAEITQSAAAITALQAENAAQGAQLGEHETAIVTLQTDLDAAEEQLAALDAAKAEVVRFALALPASSWAGTSAPYTQTLAAPGILATDRPHLGITHSGTAAQQVQQTISGGFITKLESAADSVTFTAQLAKPMVDLNLFLEVVR